MKKLIPNISKMQMGGEPPRKPIYVSNKNDPRLIAYSDSLDLYKSGKDFYKIILDDYGTVVDLDKNKTLKKLNDLNKYTNSTWRTEGINRNGKIIPFSKNMPIKFIGDSNNENSVLIPQYKKPVQPIEYKPKSRVILGGEPSKGVKPPVRDTMFVSDLKDPRLKSYQDSLALYKVGEEKKLFWKNNPNANNIELNRKEDEINKKYPLSKNRNTFGTNMIEAIGMTKIGKGSDARSVPQYKKPVQPVAYRAATNPVADTRKIQMQTTKLDTVPKTPPTPLTKKQYYEVPDANGKIALLTPEQFSRMSSRNKNDLMSKSPIMNKPKYYYEMNSSGKRQLIPENKIKEYMQTKNK